MKLSEMSVLCQGQVALSIAEILTDDMSYEEALILLNVMTIVRDSINLYAQNKRFADTIVSNSQS